MKILTKWSDSPVQVYCIYWAANSSADWSYAGRTIFGVLEDDHLTFVTRQEFTIVDPCIDAFVLMPESFDNNRTQSLMWKPLADADIWDELVDFDSDAIEKFTSLRHEYGHD